MNKWLVTTDAFQRAAFDTDVSTLERGALADYLLYNLAAAHDEISEMSAEIGWKPWDTKRGWVNQNRVLEEAVDVLMFLGNILIAAGLTDHQVSQALTDKRERVLERQAAGRYTGRHHQDD